MASAAQRQGEPTARAALPRLALLPGGAEAGDQDERVAAVADIVLGAALVLEAVFDLGGFTTMEVTSAGLREGVFFRHRLLAGTEPLLPDVRASSIRNVAIR